MKYFFSHFEGMITFAAGKSCTISSREHPQVRKEARVSGCSGVIQGAYPFFIFCKSETAHKIKGTR